MKTSAPPAPQPATGDSPDLFPAVVTYTGVLLCDAQARTMPADDEGHMVPVLVLDLELRCKTRNHHRSLQRFPAGQQAQCEAAARHYRKGMVVDVEMPLASARTLPDHTTHTHVHQPEETPS